MGSMPQANNMHMSTGLEAPKPRLMGRLGLARASVPVGVLWRAIVGEGLARARGEMLDRIGEMHRRDVVVAILRTDLVRLEQHIGVRVSGRWLKAVGGKLDEQPERVGEVDRVHEAPILDATVLDSALV